MTLLVWINGGRQAQFVILLQVDPDIRSRSEPPAKAQRRVPGNAALAEASRFSGYSVQAFFLNQGQQLKRRPARLFFASLPLAHQPDRHV